MITKTVLYDNIFWYVFDDKLYLKTTGINPRIYLHCIDVACNYSKMIQRYKAYGCDSFYNMNCFVDDSCSETLIKALTNHSIHIKYFGNFVDNGNIKDEYLEWR
jgi:hypothetical protein